MSAWLSRREIWLILLNWKVVLSFIFLTLFGETWPRLLYSNIYFVMTALLQQPMEVASVTTIEIGMTNYNNRVSRHMTIMNDWPLVRGNCSSLSFLMLIFFASYHKWKFSSQTHWCSYLMIQVNSLHPKIQKKRFILLLFYIIVFYFQHFLMALSHLMWKCH